MGRYAFAPMGQLSPWAGLGIGLEWATFSVHQTLPGSTDTDTALLGYELANLQLGADYHISSQLVVALERKLVDDLAARNLHRRALRVHALSTVEL